MGKKNSISNFFRFLAIETSQLIWSQNELTSLHMLEALILNGSIWGL